MAWKIEVMTPGGLVDHEVADPLDLVARDILESLREENEAPPAGPPERDLAAVLTQLFPRFMELGVVEASAIEVSKDDFIKGSVDSPPHLDFVRLIMKGSLVPFFGAGVGNSVRKPGEKWVPKEYAQYDEFPEFPPSGAELARFLASRVKFPTVDVREWSDLARVASYWVCSKDNDGNDVETLRELLRNIFTAVSRTGPLHHFFASVPKPLLLVTTNYDDLLEKAHQEARKDFDLVVHMTDRLEGNHLLVKKSRGGEFVDFEVPARADQYRVEKYGKAILIDAELLGEFIDLGTTTVIYKMHGSIDRENPGLDSFVITEEDYVDILSRLQPTPAAIPREFMQHCGERSFLFLGYGLRDWNLRVILKNLQRYLPQKGKGEESPSHDGAPRKEPGWVKKPKTHYAIQYKPTMAEKMLWGMRRVKICHEDLKDFARNMDEKMRGGQS